jgi:oligosaccharide repeat unit polymerase
MSLLTQAANVIDQTPSVVPYQYGQLYSYMLITLIPRAIWPDKPSMSEANRFYQVAYGLTTEDELSSVSIGVGVLAEGYISLGWVGAIGVMFLLGMFFDLYKRLLLSKGSGVFMIAIGIVLLPLMLSLESQMATYLGGIFQQVVFTFLVFLPAIRFKPGRIIADLTPTSYPVNYTR